MKTAFVIEGSHVYHARTKQDRLHELWAVEIPRVVGCKRPDETFGITKGSITSMRLRDMGLRRSTSIAEPLDAVLERHRQTHSIDCFIVVWDLVPPWDKTQAMCRWEETLAFYNGLANSTVLAPDFRTYCRERWRELSQRRQPSDRTSPPRLQVGAVVPVIVEPLFETIFMNERAMRKCLGVSGTSMPDWPKKWRTDDVRAPAILDAAVRAARRARPKQKGFRSISDDYNVVKTEWGVFFLESRRFDETIHDHALGRRLREISPTARGARRQT